ncbi:hypothetical protein [Actinokineospora sp. UTMC 2448]|uniref:hypothetical protein n=1 Tax=Actinokineospora sp. UTMC 2448 TaxID=2268449 RepID=UPI00216464FA|nr:hypothetical protein [Actinokineospora sp. UTMC 2448]UVS77463.1 hypothetical protein Actkin_01173 [Actinokineospora sp. UTMC 2448]
MSHGHEVIRDSDNALLGYVRQAGEDTWSPRTVFGHPLGPDADFHEAWETVERRGLACLADRWWFRDADGEWYACVIQEATADRVRVSIVDLGHPEVYGSRTIEKPTEATLRSEVSGPG